MTSLTLPYDYDRLTRVVTDAATSDNTRRAYGRIMQNFIKWWAAHDRPPFNRSAVQQYMQTAAADYAPSTRALHLSTLKKMATEAAARGWISEQDRHSIMFLRTPRRLGKPIGRWLTQEQVAQMFALPDPTTPTGARDLAMLALLFGAALRREEAVSVRVDQVQRRQGRWCLVDVVGKGGRVRTVPVTDEMYAHIERWLEVSQVRTGPILRRISTHRTVSKRPLKPSGPYFVVRQYARQMGIELSPHDMRRTFAALAYLNGCPIDVISESLGHSSPQTTKVYIGAVVHIEKGKAACDYVEV